MFKSLHKLLPKPVRASIWQIVAEQVKEEDARREKELWDKLPQVELEEKHIKNLKVVQDRDIFLTFMPKYSIVAEIGVAVGDFSASILNIAKPKQLHMIDSWTHDQRYQYMRESVEIRFANELTMRQVFVHQGYSITELGKFEDHFFDWVYIDTSHDYNSTIDELELCRQKVKEGGIISGHDYVTGAWVNRIRFGVVEAVNEFCVRHNFEMLMLTHERHRHLSYALRRITT